MTNLPKIQANSQLIQAVNARELHTFLQSRQQFADWIKNRIEKYEFVENQDFVCVSENYETQRMGGQRGVTVKNEYYISIDMAKELAMVENNEQGKTARKYFIECERKAKQPQTLTRLEILQIAMQAEQENIALREQVATLSPKAQALDLLEMSQGSLGVRATAKTLNIQQNKFVAWCIKHDWLYRDNKNSLCMVSNRMKQGFMEQRPVSIETPNGEIKSVIQPMFTAKGLTHLAKIFSIVSEVA